MPYFGNNPSPLLLNTVAQNGKEMTLDADADTSITADTDDQIDIKIGGADDFQFTANTFTAQSGSTIAAQALTATTITASGIIKTDDTTEATSTTDGSLQTDGGLSVVKDAVFGDDVKLLSDSAVLSFGADSEITLTHVADTGLRFEDSDKLIFGAGNDLQIYHDGSNSYIDDAGTGSLFLRSNNIIMHKYTGENLITATADAEVNLYYNDSLKLTTTSNGVEIKNGATGQQPLLLLKDMNSGVVSGDEGGGLYWYTNDSNGTGNNLAIIQKFENSAGGAGLAFETGTGGSRSERMRIDASGNIIANSGDSVATVIYDDSSGDAGPILHAEHRVDITRNSSMIALNSTTSSSASYVDLRRAGSTIGTIAHDSASTVSYNAFTGCHWGRLSDNSKPTILKGTILETIDEMCDWYEVEFTIPEIKYVDGDKVPEGKKVGDVKTKSKNKRYLVPLADIGSKKLGDSFTFTYKDGVKYTGTLKLEDDEKHSKCKVSDTADSKKVYGVFFSWDGEDDGYNDMYVAGLGTYVVRINKDVTVESGDLLVSNGDGTAKVQDDDIIRSKTVAKVLANVKQETYSDGSYTVPCALYCG